MARSTIKTRNCRIIANIIEKKSKEGLRFNLMDGFSSKFCMGCIGNVCKEYVQSHSKLRDSKEYKNVKNYYEGFQFLGIDPILLNVPASDLWGKYSGELNKIEEFNGGPTAKHAVAMLRNLASGEWNVN